MLNVAYNKAEYASRIVNSETGQKGCPVRVVSKRDSDGLPMGDDKGSFIDKIEVLVAGKKVTLPKNSSFDNEILE